MKSPERFAWTSSASDKGVVVLAVDLGMLLHSELRTQVARRPISGQPPIEVSGCPDYLTVGIHTTNLMSDIELMTRCVPGWR